MILCWSAWISSPGLDLYFTPDDGMNLVAMHQVFDKLWTADLRDTLLVVTTSYRPAGGLFYRGVYSAFGLNARAFRIAAHILLLMNLIAAYFLFRLLLGSPSASLLALIPLGYHPVFIDLYANTGAVYDLLCFLFYSLSLIAFFTLWRRGAHLAWYLAPLALYGAALGSKETAVTLPAAALLLLASRGAVARWKELALRLAPFVVLTGAYMAVKLSAAGGLTINPAYRPEFSAGRLFGAILHYSSAFFIEGRLLNAAESTALFAAFAFSVLALRSFAALRLSACAVIAMLPVAFIALRAPFASWIACAFACAAIGALFAGLVRHIPESSREIAAAVLLGGVIGLYTAWAWPWRARTFENARAAAEPLRATVEAIRGARAGLAPRSRVLVLDLPLDSGEEYTPMFFARLLFRDPSVDLVRSPSRCAPPHPPCTAALRYSGGTLGRAPLDSVTPGNLP